MMCFFEIAKGSLGGETWTDPIQFQEKGRGAFTWLSGLAPKKNVTNLTPSPPTLNPKPTHGLKLLSQVPVSLRWEAARG